MQEIGLHDGEFVDNRHWPWQLYVRQGRRIEGRQIITEHNFTVEGYMEGVLWYPKKAAGPAQPGQIPYGAMLPKRIDNLLVPVAMSSTHVAMSVLRMEPVWMTTGQIAGLAAATAREKSCEVARLDPTPLPKVLKIQTQPEV